MRGAGQQLRPLRKQKVLLRVRSFPAPLAPAHQQHVAEEFHAHTGALCDI